MDAITPREIQYLRELAKRQMEYAHLPIMEERKQLWYDHNAVMRKKPVVVIEELSFQQVCCRQANVKPLSPRSWSIQCRWRLSTMRWWGMIR